MPSYLERNTKPRKNRFAGRAGGREMGARVSLDSSTTLLQDVWFRC